MFARFDENPAMTLQDIKETKRYGRTDAWTDGRTHGQRENSIPTTNKVRGGYKDGSRLWDCSERWIKIYISILISIQHVIYRLMAGGGGGGQGGPRLWRKLTEKDCQEWKEAYNS